MVFALLARGNNSRSVNRYSFKNNPTFGVIFIVKNAKIVY